MVIRTRMVNGMCMGKRWIAILLITGIGLVASSPTWADGPATVRPATLRPAILRPAILRSGDRVALLGGSFVERMQQSGTFESELQRRRPEWKLTFRNLGWSGDDVHGYARKVFDEPASGFERLMRDVEIAKPTVAIVGYGLSEAADGDEATDRFGGGLARLTKQLTERSIRVTLLMPPVMPGYRGSGYAARSDQIRQTVASFGKAHSIPVIGSDIRPEPTTPDGLFLTGEGYRQMASSVAGSLLGETSPPSTDQSLAAKVVEKDRLFFHRYRPQNETYLFLFRKHEQGRNGAEVDRFDGLAEAADRVIWEAAAR